MSAQPYERRTRTHPANGLLGALFFLAAEAMFFIGLVFVALEIRRGSTTWPPVGAPELDRLLLLANTAVLVAASLVAHGAGRAIRSGNRAALRRRLALATALGTAFLIGQAAEFQRLGGWRPAEGTYRALFDTLAGLHGLHVAAGVGLLAVVLWRARLHQFTAERHLAVTAAELYWHFVTVAWVVLLAVLVLF